MKKIKIYLCRYDSSPDSDPSGLFPGRLARNQIHHRRRQPQTALTAYISATSGQTITGFINATGKDIGVYIGPGVKNVKVKDATQFSERIMKES